MGVRRESGYSFNGTKGVPDITAIKSGQVLFIECKAPKKLKNQSEDQFKFQIALEAHGGIYLLVDSADMLHKKIMGVCHG
jgi:Holliday junction resolvase